MGGHRGARRQFHRPYRGQHRSRADEDDFDAVREFCILDHGFLRLRYGDGKLLACMGQTRLNPMPSPWLHMGLFHDRLALNAKLRTQVVSQ